MLWIMLDWVLLLVMHIAGFIGAIHALMTKKDSRSALGWTAVCLGIPGIGIILYLLFGLNRIATVAREWESRGLWDIGNTDTIQCAPGDSCALHGDFDQRAFNMIATTGDRICARPIMKGCHLDVLYDGTQAYPEMLRAIGEAKHSIFMASYIFGARGVGAEFIDALAEATQRGVDVRVIIDGVGGLYSWPTAAFKLRRKGVCVSYFLPLLRNLYYTLHMNLRNHRKVLVVDGKLGFTGGLNIHEHNMGHNGKEAMIHDMHFKVQGPIVGMLQDVFLKSWYFATKEPIQKVVYYDNQPKGDMLCRGIPAGPHQQYALLQGMLCAALSAAQHHVRIMTPYFVLGSTLRSAIVTAALRGVNVEVILPDKNNLSFVKGAMESMLPSLLTRGVKVYYRQGNFAHTKLFLVDDYCAFVGSSNLDMRSLHLNFEFNLEVYSKPLLKELNDHFEQVKADAKRITKGWLDSQSFWARFRNSLFRLFAPYL